MSDEKWTEEEFLIWKYTKNYLLKYTYPEQFTSFGKSQVLVEYLIYPYLFIYLLTRGSIFTWIHSTPVTPGSFGAQGP
jgi:hypothetical protein